MSDLTRLDDEQVILLVKHGSPVERALADEVIRGRRAARKDSRRAEQIKKVRWLIENALMKIEALELVAGDETKADVIAEDQIGGVA